MKMPQSPPSFQELFNEANAQDRLRALMSEGLPRIQADHKRYVHWDKLRFLPPPPGLSHREWWMLLKLQRMGDAREVPLRDRADRPFVYSFPDRVAESLHFIDMGIGGIMPLPAQVTNSEMKDRYLVRSLIEEAITSSQLEGAITTRQVAKAMIRNGRAPRDRSERMIMNNYITLQEIGRRKNQPLTPELVLELHRIITSDTLDDPSAAARLRRHDEPINVVDMYGTVFHAPPGADELPARLKAMCAFANAEAPKSFIHPVLRSIILHFWLAYDHPFVDGNGRTARALFYWSMLRAGYWLCEFISISQMLLKAPMKYYRAFLYTETDDNDLTYFIMHHLNTIQRAIDELHRYINDEIDRTKALRRRLRGLELLNNRQCALLEHAISHADSDYTIEGHQLSHRVVYETARSDLLDLVKRGLLESRKMGREYRFRPPADLEERLHTLS